MVFVTVRAFLLEPRCLWTYGPVYVVCCCVYCIATIITGCYIILRYRVIRL